MSCPVDPSVFAGHLLVVENVASAEDREVLLGWLDSPMNRIGPAWSIRSPSSTVLYYSQMTEPVRSVVRRIALEVALKLDYAFRCGGLFVEAAFLAVLDPGGSHVPHADNEQIAGDGTNWEPNHTPYRDYSCLIYLNSDFEGGRISFPNQQLVLTPTEGLMVAFPGNRRYVHGVEPVTAGRRVSIALWFTRSWERRLAM